MRGPSRIRVTTRRTWRGLIRLDEVVADVGAERLGERRVLLALRDHDDRKVRVDLAQLAVAPRGRASRHLLVEQDEVERTAADHLDGVVGVRRRLDLVTLVTQEDAVRLEQLRLVVDPIA